MAKRILSSLLGLLCLISFYQVGLADPPAEETEWGDLTGRLIYDGDPPERAAMIRMGFPITLDESLVIDPETQGIANVFIYLRASKKDHVKLPVHPEVAKKIKKPVRGTIGLGGYAPHALLLHTDQKLVISNTAAGNKFASKIDFFANGPRSSLIPPKAAWDFKLLLGERMPSAMACNIHPWMSGFILVQDTPYMALTDKDGKFTIKNLPVGEHEFQFWQERVGYLELPIARLRDVELDGDRDKGQLRVVIQPGENDLGKIKIDPKVFER